MMPDLDIGSHNNKDQYQKKWGMPYSLWRCKQCKWTYLISENMKPVICPACFHLTLVQIENDEPAPLFISSPELLIPFSVDVHDLAKRMENFARAIPFAPEYLTAQALINRVQKIFIPTWLVDSSIIAEWSGEFGYDYDILSHQDQYNENAGGWKSNEVAESRIRWEPRIGRLNRTYSNIPAPALQDIHPMLKQQITFFEKKRGIPFQPAAITDSFIHLPDRAQADAWTDAVPSFLSASMEECRLACEADQIRQFRWRPDFQNQNWTLLLLPVYTTFYKDDEETIQHVFINGQTGQFTGIKRGSMKHARKTGLIILSIAASLFIIGLLLSFLSVMAPMVIALSGFLILAAIIIGVGAIIPVLRVWQFNRE